MKGYDLENLFFFSMLFHKMFSAEIALLKIKKDEFFQSQVQFEVAPLKPQGVLAFVEKLEKVDTI